MKMITAVVQDQDAAKLGKALVQADIRATRLASTGGFLKAGSTTFMIGIDDDRVDEALAIIKDSAQKRDRLMTPAYSMDTVESAVVTPMEVEIGGATVFVQDVAQFHQF
ncbi:hypothetical protein D3P96_00965 [Weissella viridescens]|uniref:Protein from nitrogen regulatory protein P-II (GLNB) family n=1 Tax=Weissella viridescens TaxID=1629 RepID=A0A3P2RDA8_WEIVI|nr:cyclic-di-AMP receptor [Weissella viridescens]RRG18584.1 hypothetical protein D3P96_00965 [Weissella viridescens]